MGYFRLFIHFFPYNIKCGFKNFFFSVHISSSLNVLGINNTLIKKIESWDFRKRKDYTVQYTEDNNTKSREKENSVTNLCSIY